MDGRQMPREPDHDEATEPSPDPELLRAEAARYALLCRLSPALRHEAAAPLQPIAMAASVLEKHLDACAPELLPLRDGVQRLVRYAREAARVGLDLVAWLEPERPGPAAGDERPDQRPLAELVEDAFALLATPLGFEGFTLEAQLAGTDAARALPAASLRLLLPAGLLWLSDQPGPPGALVLESGQAAGIAVLRMTRSPGTPPKEKADSLREPAYRRLGLSELQVLARSEGLDLRRREGGPQPSLELALPS